jgi:predicted nucleotidyltransferase
VEAVARTGAADDRPLASDDSLAARERKRLLERELARYLRLLAEHSDPEQVIVLGSLASGDIQPWSDIDLVIIEQTELSFWQRLQVRKLLRPQVGTDILVYTPEEFERLRQERSFFREEILAKGVIVYERAA